MRTTLLHLAVEFDRVSSLTQEDGFSLIAQSQAAFCYADRCGLKIVRTWSEIESASKEDQRSAFFEMVDFVKAHGIGHVIFDKVDRAVRGFKSAQVLQDLTEKHGVTFHFVRDNLTVDSDSPPSEKLRFYLGTILAKYYIDNLKADIRKGVEARIKAGHWCYQAPLGYRNWRDPETRRAIVIRDQTVCFAIAEIFRKYATGKHPMPSLVCILNQATGKEHNWRILTTMLANPFYPGSEKPLAANSR